MLPYRTMLFDFDYTLGDSSRGIGASVNAALTALNYPVPKPDLQGIHLAACILDKESWRLFIFFIHKLCTFIDIF